MSDLYAVNWSDVTVGLEAEPFEIGPVSRTDIVCYQGASGDMNPVHHDEPFAQSAGFDAPLGVGMYPAGAMHAWLAGWMGPERTRRARTRWKSAYFPGDTLSFTASVVSKDDEKQTVEVEAVCVNQKGAVTMQGWATFQF